MVVYYVYILEVVANNGKKMFYTGYTNNLYRRWNEHRSGTGAKFCRGKKNIKLRYFETFSNRSEAITRELEIKTYSRQMKRELINSLNMNVKS
jgi:putative endonuclease